jgi:chemotaxis protein MotB
MLIISALFFLSTAVGWSAGYQEEKLLDTSSYSSDDLKKKADEHKIEIQVLEDQIKDLKADSDWMILKINQIRDSGRIVQTTLKTALRNKEDKIKELTKTKKRLESLVKYYSAIEKSKQNVTFESVVDKKIAALESKPKKPEKKEAAVQPKKISSLKGKTSVSRTELLASIEKAGLQDWVEIQGTGTCLRLETILPILFPTGSAVIAGEYKPFFRKLAELLKPYDVKILVNGYTDTVPIHNKKYPSNFELGANRASNVIHQLVAYGLKPSIFKIESTGEYRFAAKKPSTQKAFERRAEIIVIFAG